MAGWSEEAEDQMITMVQERPALYDSTEKRYTNRVVKTQLWREIEEKLDISDKELKKRWDSLRTQYTRYKKLAPALKTGRQQLILSRLQFLEPHTKRREGTTHLTTREPSTTADSDSPSDDTSSETRTSTPAQTSTAIEEPCFFADEPRPCTPLAESTVCGAETTPTLLRELLPSSSSQSSAPRPLVKRSRRILDESTSEESANLMRVIGKTLESLASEVNRTDDISAYCKNIEHRMRKLPPHLLPHFQHEVDTLLFRYSVDQSPANQNFN